MLAGENYPSTQFETALTTISNSASLENMGSKYKSLGVAANSVDLVAAYLAETYTETEVT